MKVVYGTFNPAKLKHMQDMLTGLDLEVLGLWEVGAPSVKAEESGNSPLENARLKAMAYHRALGLPVFSCDAGLTINGLPDVQQPGVYVRRVAGRELTDEEMILHYTGIAKKLGGKALARYQNAVCFVADEAHVFEHDKRDIATRDFYLTGVVNPKRNQGYPLDSISVEVDTGAYFVDNSKDLAAFEGDMTRGYRRFFTGALELLAALK